MHGEINEKNITCLLGAGASCYALPIENEFPSNLQEFLSWMDNVEDNLNDGSFGSDFNFNDITQKEARDEFIQDIRDLVQVHPKHRSFDEYARALYLEEEDDMGLNRFKALMSGYMTLEQARKECDPRYISFLARYFPSNIDFSNLSNIKVISWNYDNQVEKAFRHFGGMNVAESLYSLILALSFFLSYF